MKLLEVTVGPVQVNELAVVTAAKTISDIASGLELGVDAPDAGRIAKNCKPEDVEALRKACGEISAKLGELLSEPPKSPDSRAWIQDAEVAIQREKLELERMLLKGY